MALPRHVVARRRRRPSGRSSRAFSVWNGPCTGGRPPGGAGLPAHWSRTIRPSAGASACPTPGPGTSACGRRSGSCHPVGWSRQPSDSGAPRPSDMPGCGNPRRRVRGHRHTSHVSAHARQACGCTDGCQRHDRRPQEPNRPRAITRPHPWRRWADTPPGRGRRATAPAGGDGAHTRAPPLLTAPPPRPVRAAHEPRAVALRTRVRDGPPHRREADGARLGSGRTPPRAAVSRRPPGPRQNRSG
jgi:hypothetical protein